jgi:hypothetical protein
MRTVFIVMNILIMVCCGSSIQATMDDSFSESSESDLSTEGKVLSQYCDL